MFVNNIVMERKDYSHDVEEKDSFYKIDCSLFVISFIVVLSKAVIAFLISILIMVLESEEQNWSSFPYFSDFWDAAVFHPFTSSLAIISTVLLSVEWLLKPILFGLMMSFLTWQIVYLDSEKPGVNPPTPFTYHKYYGNNRLGRNHRFHLCYLFAMAVAPLTTFSILINNYFS